ncbi:MAG: dihydroorotate dehydrogenase electron transfer subunit [Candidatus Neomarinimicrobiota bacterium]
MVIEAAQVRSNRPLASDMYALEMTAPAIAAAVQPGQFVNILIDEGWSPLLRRPMSVASRAGDTLGLIYKIVGPGTHVMASWQAGATVNLMGPLGNGWELAEGLYPVLLAGGVGVAPISYLHDELQSKGIEHQLVMGARSRNQHYLDHTPEKGITLTTDDGSQGIQGSVLAGLEAVVAGLGDTELAVYGCGPPPMLRAVRSYVEERGMACQLAMETMMACGFGFCQGCSIKMAGQFDSGVPSYRERFKLACLDGPVFRADELA